MSIFRVVSKHPAFGHAALSVCQVVNEEGSGRDADRITTGLSALDINNKSQICHQNV